MEVGLEIRNTNVYNELWINGNDTLSRVKSAVGLGIAQPCDTDLRFRSVLVDCSKRYGVQIQDSAAYEKPIRIAVYISKFYPLGY